MVAEHSPRRAVSVQTLATEQAISKATSDPPWTFMKVQHNWRRWQTWDDGAQHQRNTSRQCSTADSSDPPDWAVWDHHRRWRRMVSMERTTDVRIHKRADNNDFELVFEREMEMDVGVHSRAPMAKAWSLNKIRARLGNQDFAAGEPDKRAPTGEPQKTR